MTSRSFATIRASDGLMAPHSLGGKFTGIMIMIVSTVRVTRPSLTFSRSLALLLSISRSLALALALFSRSLSLSLSWWGIFKKLYL